MSSAVVSISAVNSDEGDGVLEFLTERLTQLKFYDRDTKVDKCELTLQNRNKDLLDNPYTKKGQEYLISWGTTEGMNVPRRMILKKSKEAGTSLVVILKDKSVLMDKEKKKRRWRNTRDSDVVRQIFEEQGYGGLLTDVVDTPVYRESITQTTSDARLVTKLARKNGFKFWVDAAGAHFRPRSTMAEPIRWFTWLGYKEGDGQILEPGPSIEANFSKDIAMITVEAIDPYTMEEVRAIRGVTTDDKYDASLGESNEIGDPDNLEGQRQPRVTRTDERNIGFATQEEVEAEAEYVYRMIASGRYKMKMPIKGDIQIGAKMLIGLRNYSDAYSGLYYVKEAVTTIARGSYKMDLECIRDALGRLYLNIVKPVSKKKNPNDKDGDGKSKKLKRFATMGYDSNNNYTMIWAYSEPGDPKTIQMRQDMTEGEKIMWRGTVPGAI